MHEFIFHMSGLELRLQKAKISKTSSRSVVHNMYDPEIGSSLLSTIILDERLICKSWFLILSRYVLIHTYVFIYFVYQNEGAKNSLSKVQMNLLTSLIAEHISTFFQVKKWRADLDLKFSCIMYI